MKKYIYLILGFLCCSYLFYYILNLEKYNSKLKNDLQKELYIKYYLETIHKQSNKLLGKRINFSLVKDSSRFNLKEVCKFPCLITFLPDAENTCMSCINYALSSINNLYPEYAKDSSFVIISKKYHPELKERIIRKKIYFVDELCNDTLDIMYDLPIYFLVDENLKIISSFIPNGDMNTRIYVERYLNSTLKYINGSLNKTIAH